MRSICVYCGSSPGNDPAYWSAAVEFGTLLGRQGIRLVYGGGDVGLMGAIADAVMAAGGEVVGVIPQGLVDREVAHLGLTELHVTRSMHERKAMMAELADGFVAMPGGLGTLEELFEILTWAQLGLHHKPVGLLNVAGYYDALVAFVDGTVKAGFVREEHRALFCVDTDGEALLAQFESWTPQSIPKWLGMDET
jgi:uncharacterized protein (TIGR00730 family)